MPRKGYVYRGTRPKHARSVSSDEFSIYCELCECEYSVSRTTPVDQWLNRHQAHTDCLEKKASREAVVDEEGIFVRRYVRPRTLSSSDRVFVFDGVRQPTNKFDDDEISVQSGNDFEMDLPMDHDAEDEQIYEDYNSNVRGFFSEGFSAEEIGQPYLPHRIHQCTYNTVHMEELTRDKANLVTTDVAFPTTELSDIQEQLQVLLDANKGRSDFVIRSRFRRENTSSKKRLSDMVDLYDWGLRQVILFIVLK